MRKFLAHGFAFLLGLTLVVVSIIPLHVHAQMEQAVFAQNLVATGVTKGVSGVASWISDLALTVPGWIASYIVLPLAGWVTTLAGLLLNFVVNETVVGMADKLCTVGTTPNCLTGIGSVINSTWTTVRDVANMFFIFVILYTAILTIFNRGNYRRTILNLIIAAVLINFSLFFTKVIIDLGNIVALMFYHAIVGVQLPGSSAFDTGISNALMDQLHVTSIWKTTGVLNGSRLVTIGIMGTIFALIAAFVFLAVAVMFVVRFVVLIFVMILSPLMFIGLILPEGSGGGLFKQWWNALLGQTFFAPIYFFLTWIVVQLGQGLYGTLGLTAQTSLGEGIAGTYGADGKFAGSVGTFGIVLNFVMMIAFLLLSLSISKKYADKAGSTVSGATRWATGAAGGAFFGGIGAVGRGTIGRYGASKAEDPDLIKKAASGDRRARLQLWASKKAAGATFDTRNASASVPDVIAKSKVGRILNLDELGSAKVGEIAAGRTGVGTGGTLGYQGKKEKREKEDREREQKKNEEVKRAEAQIAVRDGLAAAPGTPAEKEMEVALNKMSDKQLEELVVTNRELLKNEKFANKISVQQLEALNKSEKIDEAEKDLLKENRFKAVNQGLTAAPGAPAATALPGAVKALSDEELAMINPEHLNNPAFISNLRPAQVEAINKSKKFTKSQKDSVKSMRITPVLNALRTRTPADIALAQDTLRKMNDKDRAALMNTSLTPGGRSILLDGDILPIYSPRMLKRMAQEMEAPDILALRGALLAGGSPSIVAWLNDPDKGAIEFA